MNSKKRFPACLLGLALCLAGGWATAQDLHPSRRASPMGTARIMLDDDTYLRVVYSRPYKRGRDIIFGKAESGALVPWGEIWRTGANEASEITTTRDILVGDRRLAAGTYSLFTTPGPESWQIHFNSALGLSGTGRFDSETGTFEALDLAATDVLVIEVPVSRLDEEIDQFTIAFEPTQAGADLVLRWILTEVRIPLSLP